MSTLYKSGLNVKIIHKWIQNINIIHRWLSS